MSFWDKASGHPSCERDWAGLCPDLLCLGILSLLNQESLLSLGFCHCSTIPHKAACLCQGSCFWGSSCAVSASFLGHPCPPYWRQQVVSCLNEAPFWACLQTGRPGNSPVLLTTSEKAKCFVQIAKEQGSFSWPFLLLRRTLAGGDKQNTSKCQGL